MKLFKSQLRRIAEFVKVRRRQLSNPVLVYQMGKVASSSVYRSLREVVGINAFHVHRLNPENIARVRGEHLRRGDVAPSEEEGIYLYENLIRSRKIPAKIITLIREPIARNISAYFQNLQSFERISNAHDIIEVERLIERFLQKYDHHVPLEWFDVELCSTTGIDIYQHDFPKRRGHQVIDSPPYRLLIMRHDLDDSLKEKCIAEFLGTESFCLTSANKASSKEYAKVYKEFLSSVKLSSEYVERMLSSRYARHFYSTEELSALSKKWTTTLEK